ncbi:unnamed protein product [Echinostoma caproni]|uniref:RING-type domain-containing protein n=1 Tax=Echinostoma caproni TaxID=27848 RepID=A0A3P8GWA6_9TREM|nr:unnamed protein product [Echinostoma caproni]
MARLPRWTIRQPRNRAVHTERSKSRLASDKRSHKPTENFLTQIVETAERGKLDGSRARLANWGSIMSTGLLAPGRQCRICLMSFQMGDEVRRLVPGCEHIFHAACIDPWLLHQ